MEGNVEKHEWKAFGLPWTAYHLGVDAWIEVAGQRYHGPGVVVVRQYLDGQREPYNVTDCWSEHI